MDEVIEDSRMNSLLDWKIHVDDVPKIAKLCKPILLVIFFETERMPTVPFRWYRLNAQQDVSLGCRIEKISYNKWVINLHELMVVPYFEGLRMSLCVSVCIHMCLLCIRVSRHFLNLSERIHWGYLYDKIFVKHNLTFLLRC